MIINSKLFNENLIFEDDKINIIQFNDIDEIYKFISTLKDQMNDDEEMINLFIGDNKIKIESEVDYIYDLFGLKLNTTKNINFLHKKIITELGKSNKVFAFDKVKETILNWVKEIRRETLIEYDIDEDIEEVDILKLSGVKYIDEKETLYEKMLSYLNLIIEIKKTKVLFINFAIEIFRKEQILEIVDICREQKIVVVFIEKTSPNLSEDIQKYTITDGFIL